MVFLSVFSFLLFVLCYLQRQLFLHWWKICFSRFPWGRLAPWDKAPLGFCSLCKARETQREVVLLSSLPAEDRERCCKESPLFQCCWMPGESDTVGSIGIRFSKESQGGWREDTFGVSWGQHQGYRYSCQADMRLLISNSWSFVALYNSVGRNRQTAFEVCRERRKIERKESWTCQLELEMQCKLSGVPEAATFKSVKEQLYVKEQGLVVLQSGRMSSWGSAEWKGKWKGGDAAQKHYFLWHGVQLSPTSSE